MGPIKWFCQWYLRRFPPRKPEGRYPAKEPWVVTVALTTDTGKEYRHINFTEDRMMYWRGDEDWTLAEDYALSRADSIKTNGFTEWVDGSKDHYPVHRVYLVHAYPKPSEPKVSVAVD